MADAHDTERSVTPATSSRAAPDHSPLPGADELSGHRPGLPGRRPADFDNWAICDTACFHLFDRTPFAWEKARQWLTSPREFVKRAAFALMVCLAANDKSASDAQFLALYPMIEQGTHDERNFVKKAVNWALRRVGEHNLALNAAALAAAKRLARSEEAVCP